MKPVAAGRGHAPREALCRGGNWRGENMELWNLAASGEWRLHCRQWYFYTP